ncbi:DoxX family protein [Streptomyces lancefieldiae]|uniref:DoxX family protein n=1 Tax=Streptomyces lancefieldiae TaxID=3075520 RepID=A0ABU3AKR4_9ACTN|nr:DoxX family protein [Streptomyces sp. DSM 40712]MDT0610778.1 DoxX family protein [Streptomyces sp. DSM 40712]
MSETAASTAPRASVASTASTAAATPTRGRGARIALRTVQVVLALFFAVASALPKLIAHSSASDTFAEMGWGDAGMYAIGVLELAGAVALLIPVLQSAAATALSALMAGAFVIQLTYFDGENAVTPLILMVPLLLIARARRRHNEELLRRVRGRHA